MPVDSAVEFKDVSFTYPDTKKAILDQISFKIKRRETAFYFHCRGATYLI